ncbi:elongation factor P [SAR202 cluster bacterium AC-409-J13_OGT_754m]|nr:elongation factor P [SAR202 cluster bacterium AC-409-J13_OGT_754m]
MASLGFGDLRKGLNIEIDGQPFEVLDYQRHKMQQRAPVTRIKVRNLLTGSVTEKTFQAYETSFSPADVESRASQYLYTDAVFYFFMDHETYDQYELSKDQIGSNTDFLKEEITIDITFYNGKIIGIKLPTFVDLVVSHSPPGLKGDSAQGGTKPATLETGLNVNVPLFVQEGNVVKIDTRNSQYVERVN